ncbi:MAG: methyltransferase domain-containing protein [Proteobacteria bacterium]|nr:methyltransferase domain-containing protein [Pseudomonadota bacterium]
MPDVEMSDEDYRLKRRQEWDEAGRRYDKLATGALADLSAQAAAKVLEIARLRDGETVLDVGTGPGSPALEAAPLVAPDGKVTGIDFAPSMIVAARKRAGELGIGNADFFEMEAERLDFQDNTFDCAISRYAYPHFTNARLALKETLRVLRRGGRLVAAMHGAAERNPYFGGPIAALTRYHDVPSPITERGPFAFSEAGSLEAAMKSAGFADVTIHVHNTTIVVDDFDQYWTAQKAGGAAIRRALEKVPQTRRPEAEVAALASMQQYVVGNRASFPAQIIVGAGWKH